MNIIRNIFQTLQTLLYGYGKISANITDYKLTMEQMQQVEIMNQYRLLFSITETTPNFRDTGFKVYSQFDEDGILLYIFSLIGFTNRKVVEVCAGNGEECNTANLIINHSCHGLLFDGNKENVEHGVKFYSQNPATMYYPPIFKNAWITKDNINTLLEEEKFTGEIDLLSLDIDGNDYWVWKNLTAINPRVFVCECHTIIPDNLSVTIPYNENFNYKSNDNYHKEFRSASPLAMINLSKEKGYRLIAVNKYNFNHFYLREDVGKGIFNEITLTDIYTDPLMKELNEKRWANVRDAPWIHV